MNSDSRKQRLLKRHRRKNRLVMAFSLLFLACFGVAFGFAWIPLLLLLEWLAHEAWFSDHLFYAPGEDYAYRFDDRVETLPARFEAGRLTLAPAQGHAPGDDDTLLLGVTLRATWLGRFLDPAVIVEGRNLAADRQTFERGVNGLRYLNLTGGANALRADGLRLRGRHCRLIGEPVLRRASHPDYRGQRILVIAPHADDAELAAFGLYSQAKEAWIVTLTAGEIETQHYRRMGLNGVEAARLKGALRAWDSVAVPSWGGVPPGRCVQLGYFCLQLPAMRAEPDKPIASREADLADTRPFRRFNHIRLPSDENGVPSWRNLVADLRQLVAAARPEVIVLPHPRLDPHPDHMAASAALRQALAGCAWQPQTLLHYTNHLHDNDRWPMGEAHAGVPLPPLMEDAGPLVPCLFCLDEACQRDKAMALGMMHDLRTPPPFKRRLRRAIQRVLAARRHPPWGENEYFRKAVRRHEVFFQAGISSGEGL
ncbi:MAG: PIG-L family deacetylase [Candidatus Accumulibacter sp.]|jgi:LmbE family N-acetylglucosaminyl deacetylase|nr:PIG-L family deacetylase [Accumulibacter sp.]